MRFLEHVGFVQAVLSLKYDLIVQMDIMEVYRVLLIVAVFTSCVRWVLVIVTVAYLLLAMSV